MLICVTSGAVTRMTAWADSRYGIESCWKILGERSVAVPLYSAGSTEDTIYSDMVPLWLYKRPSLIEGLTSSHISV